MLSRDLNNPKLTKNDKKVLNLIVEHSKLPDSKIADNMKISPQAVFKIRTKLENLGIITGYKPIINYKKIGIQVFTLVVIRLKPVVWRRFSDDFITNALIRVPHLVNAYRVPGPQASHIFLFGFKDVRQREYYLSQIQTKYADEMEIKDVYTFSSDKLIMLNSYRFLNEIIDEGDFKQELFSFLKKKKVQINKR